MKNYLNVDIANARLVMDRTFAKNCAIAGSAEYNLLQSARKDYPNFTVEQRTIKRNANKECYRGLTYHLWKQTQSLGKLLGQDDLGVDEVDFVLSVLSHSSILPFYCSKL